MKFRIGHRVALCALIAASAAVSQGQVRMGVGSPRAMSALTGQAVMGGWALSDTAAIASVTYSVDGGIPVAASYGGARPDACTAWPNHVACPNVGWTAVLDTTKLSNGQHNIVIIATDTLGGVYPYSAPFFALNGIKGDKGDKGDTGATGQTGPQGLPGTPGTSATPYVEVEECDPAIGVIDGTNLSLKLSIAPAPGTLVGVYENGVRVTTIRGDYSRNGQAITWASRPQLQLGDHVCVDYWHQ